MSEGGCQRGIQRLGQDFLLRTHKRLRLQGRHTSGLKVFDEFMGVEYDGSHALHPTPLDNRTQTVALSNVV